MLTFILSKKGSKGAKLFACVEVSTPYSFPEEPSITFLSRL